MALTVVLSRSLQKVNQDLFEAMQSIQYICDMLKEWRGGADDEDDDTDSGSVDAWDHDDYGAFTVPERLASTANVPITVPRLTGRQTSRNNVAASNASEYYKRAVWYPYLDCTLQALRNKFSLHHLAVLKLVALVPAVVLLYDWPDIVDSCRVYST